MKGSDLLRKMREHAETAIRYCDGCSSYAEFAENGMLMDACMHHVGQIGEFASIAIRDSIDKNYPTLMWAAMRNLRNRIYHNYDGVNRENMWETITNDLPDHIKEIDKRTTPD